MQEYMSHMKMRMSERKSVQGRCSRQVSVAAVPMAAVTQGLAATSVVVVGIRVGWMVVLVVALGVAETVEEAGVAAVMVEGAMGVDMEELMAAVEASAEGVRAEAACMHQQ